MRFLLSLLFLTFLATYSFAQPEIVWTSIFGTAGSDQCYDVQPAFGGGYVLVGHYNPDGTALESRDFAVVKVDSDGNLVWEQTYGGAGEQRGFAISQAPWGDYIACGFTQNNSDDFYLLKISDEDGSLIDSYTYDYSGDDWAYDLEITSDTSFVITGKTEVNGFVAGYTALIDQDFEVIWENITTANDDAWLRGVHVDENGVTVAGYWEDEGSNNELMIRQIDHEGNFSWSTISGTASTNDDQLYNVVGANDGGYVGAGYVRDPSNNRLLAIMKVNSEGVFQWSNFYGGLGLDWGYDIDNYGSGFVAVAYGNSFGPNPANTDMLLYALDENGDSLWMMTLGEDPTFDKATSVFVDEVQDIYVAGYTQSYGAEGDDFCLIKINPSDNTPPGASSLLEPEDNFTATTDSIYFQWTEAFDPDEGDEITYHLQISIMESFEIENVIFENSGSEFFYYCYEIFPDDTTLYWRVLNEDNFGASIPSNVYSLNIAYPDPPNSFSLIAPEDGSYFSVSTEISFYWQSTIDPDPDSELEYQLEISLDESFSEVEEILYTGVDTTYSDFISAAYIEEYLYWRVLAIDNNTNGTYSNEIKSFYLDGCEIEGLDNAGLPTKFGLSAYPNPFNPTLNISLAVPQTESVSVVVYDLLGREVVTLNDSVLHAGIHTILWRAEVSTGTYILVAKSASGWKGTEKLLYLK